MIGRSGTLYAWNSTRTNYFTQTFVSGRYVSACGTLYAARVGRRYRVTNRQGAEVGWSESFQGLGRYLDDITSTINPDR